MSKSEEKQVIHNLFTREVRPIRNWHEWLERWQSAATVEEMLGLLHAGFSVSLEHSQYGEKEYDSIDRDIFYFTIADGWADDDLLRTPLDEKKHYPFGCNEHDRTVQKSASELRQVVAHKAFDMLCLNFFRVELKEDGRGERFGWRWGKEIASARLFPIILDFFRIEQSRFRTHFEIRNLNRSNWRELSHNEQLARKFLLNLARFVWGWKEVDTRYSGKDKEAVEKWIEEMHARLDAAKPWMVEVLVNLDGFDLLREWILELNKPCLAKLKEIALRSELSQYPHPVVKNRKVATLDEACYTGSRTAWLLKERELKMREDERLKAILAAEHQREEANQKIQKLTPR